MFIYLNYRLSNNWFSTTMKYSNKKVQQQCRSFCSTNKMTVTNYIRNKSEYVSLDSCETVGNNT